MKELSIEELFIKDGVHFTICILGWCTQLTTYKFKSNYVYVNLRRACRLYISLRACEVDSDMALYVEKINLDTTNYLIKIVLRGISHYFGFIISYDTIATE